MAAYDHDAPPGVDRLATFDLLDLLPKDHVQRGQLLRILREVRGYRQKAVEAKLGLSQKDLSRIEKASRRASDSIVCRLLLHYRATSADLLFIGLLLGYLEAPSSFELILSECEFST